MKNSYSSVKNYQEDNNIRLMYNKAFNITDNNIEITKLSGGLKNAVYGVKGNDLDVVLKIAPQDENKMIFVDRNILWWEAEMLNKMESINIPSPKLLYYDDSLELCSSPYFFMTRLEGMNYSDIKKNLNEEEKYKVEREMGLISKIICDIKAKEFFLPGFPEQSFKNNFEFVNFLFEKLLENAWNRNMDLDGNYENIRSIIRDYHDEINDISNLCLTHTDIWDGNVLVKDGKVSGVVDFADLYCCDELMTFYFHTIDGVTSPAFLDGFGKTELTEVEKKRIDVYRLYIILKMAVDCELKEYGRFDWLYDNLNNRVKTLSKKK